MCTAKPSGLITYADPCAEWVSSPAGYSAGHLHAHLVCLDRTELINETHHSAFLGSNNTLFKHNSNVMQKGVLIGILILKPIKE